MHCWKMSTASGSKEPRSHTYLGEIYFTNRENSNYGEIPIETPIRGDVDVTTNLNACFTHIATETSKLHRIKITTCMSSLSPTQNICTALVYFISMSHLSRLRTFNAPEVQAPQQRIFWMLTLGSTGRKGSKFGSIHVCWFKMLSQVHSIVNCYR